MHHSTEKKTLIEGTLELKGIRSQNKKTNQSRSLLNLFGLWWPSQYSLRARFVPLLRLRYIMA